MGEIKVTDRRMFTPDGRLREEFEAELEGTGAEEDAPPGDSPSAADPTPPSPPPPAPDPSPVPGPAPTSALPESAPEVGKPPTGLLELVQFLGELTLACLGDVPQPDGRLLRDLDAARFYIDLVGSLLERFGPGLAPQDRRALESFLDQIRLRYVSRSG